MRTIYEPKGRAREYSRLALNIYDGCGHGCRYCYARDIAVRFGSSYEAFNTPKLRKGDFFGALDNAAELLSKKQKNTGEHVDILLSYMCDPYSIPIKPDIIRGPVSQDYTRKVLLVLEKHKLNVSILTKAGIRACFDFDILARNKWKFGSSITCFGKIRAMMEPNAATAQNRFEAVKIAKKMGIFTWISLEPVIDVDQALEILKWDFHNDVDMWKIGKINHHPELEKGIDWKKFVHDARTIIGDRPHMFKNDLLIAAGESV
jgi:DNA repair photolyase